MSTWQFGVGRSAAFTSDLLGNWSADWLAWPELGRLLSQTARWLARHRGSGELDVRLHPSVRLGRIHATLVVEATRANGDFVNRLELDASVVDDEGAAVKVDLRQTAPGRYQARFPSPKRGRYLARIATREVPPEVNPEVNPEVSLEVDPEVKPETFGFAVPYSDEYRRRGVDLRSLQTIASGAAGEVVSYLAMRSEPPWQRLDKSPAPGSVGLAFDSTSEQGALWWPLVWIGLALLVIEVGLRRWFEQRQRLIN